MKRTIAVLAIAVVLIWGCPCPVVTAPRPAHGIRTWPTERERPKRKGTPPPQKDRPVRKVWRG